MLENNSQDNPSLLRVFLLSMAGIAVLFSLMSLGIWVSTSNASQRERQLINELLPELDSAHLLTAATAGLQAKGFLLRTSRTASELGRHRKNLDLTITEIVQTLDGITTVAPAKLVSLRQSVGDLTGDVIRLAEIRSQQIELQSLIAEELPLRLALLKDLEKKVGLRVVVLTEQLLDISTRIMDLEAEGHIDASGEDPFIQLLSEYESISLSIQDHLLFSRDVVAQAALLEKVPLLTDQQDVVLALQSRDLIVSALTSRSIYMAGGDQGGGVLEYLREMYAKTAGRQSLFMLQEEVLVQESTRSTLYAQLTANTDSILEETSKLRSESSIAVQLLTEETLKGLDNARRLPIILSVIGLFLLVIVSYWLLYRKTVLPLMTITRQLDDVGSSRYPKVVPAYYLKEFAVLSSAMTQLDTVQKNKREQDLKLQQINIDLKRANEDLQQFAHIASHDLQEPLRKLQQFSDILLEDYSSELDKDGKFFIKTIHNSAERMSVLIKETLAYSRSGSRNQKLVRVDLSQLLQSLHDEMDVALQDAEGEFIIENMPVVLANELGMAQLFRNLMINGLKYRSPGTPARVRISAEPDTGGAISLRVEDNGIGIPDKFLQRIFVPFMRLHDSNVPGTGLGLAICKKVCESHGWDIDVSSEVNAGTVFVIRIPKRSIRD